MHEEDKKMTITPVTYPSVSADSLSKPPAVTTDEAQKLKQKETGEAQKPAAGFPTTRGLIPMRKAMEKCQHQNLAFIILLKRNLR